MSTDDGQCISISESKSDKIRLLSISRILATRLIDILRRPDYTEESWEITCYDGDSSLKVVWESNRLFSKGLAQFHRESEDRILESSQPPLLNGTTRISGNAKIDTDEGWRCVQSERLYGREEEGQTESANKVFMDSALKLEFERTQSHSTDGKIDQESMKQFDQVIKDNLNLFRKSMANTKFLHALNKGQILGYSEDVVRVTRETMKSFEYIDAAVVQGAKYPVYLAYANEDMLGHPLDIGPSQAPQLLIPHLGHVEGWGVYEVHVSAPARIRAVPWVSRDVWARSPRRSSTSSNSRHADQSASGRDLSQTQSSHSSPPAMPGQKLRQLRKQFPSSTPARRGSRVKLDESIMALCHCQVTNRGFADVVGPSIEVPRPSSTQTALDALSGFFTVHLASLMKGLCKDIGVKPTLDHFLFTFKLTKGHKHWVSYASLSQRSSKLFTNEEKGSTKDWKPFFVFVSTGHESPFTGSGLPSFRRIPCPPSNATLLSMTHQLCGRGAVNINEVVTEESLAKMGFEFVQDELRHQPELLRDVHGGSQPDLPRGAPEGGLDCGPFVEPQGLDGEMDSDLLLGRFMAGKNRKRDATKQSKSKRSSSRGEAIHSPPRSLIPGGDLAGSSQAVTSERPPSSPAVTYEVVTEGRSMRFNIPPPSPSLGDVQLETFITLPAQDRARISAGSEDDLNSMILLRLSQEEVARLMRELDGKEVCCAVLEAEKASLSSEVESVSARVVELEGEKTDLIQQLEVERSDRVHHVEEAIESFKSSPDFSMVAMERMDKLTTEWLKTDPGAQWMVKEGTKSFNCGLFRAQQVFCDKLARLPKGFSLPVLGFPPPCRALAEFDPSPYLDGGSSSASDEEEEEEADLRDQGELDDQNPGASLATSKAGGDAGSSI
ncbi:unnamed protein product [Cuscuta campestris]|uniref:Uncharacterized protein n=1 Tax=Cuscuta campestris TaxID=132261 RepID=A0A484N031_9ASTE|nr:unnamed protein product [Cuscuta campestris]